MGDEELLNLVLVFDAGPPVHINGRIFYNDQGKLLDLDRLPSDYNSHNYTIEKRGDQWAICHGRVCLDKQKDCWEYESYPSERTEEFINATRFVSYYHAFHFLREWRLREYKRAIAEGFTEVDFREAKKNYK